ncbi:MAG: hypothetical protein HFH97_08155 [Lachnospiraceae bacterium]|nr:hypothetical protein [uncultured Acetatifactor sp.]MCI9572569.1 hypothetical protein [Lachnospiraceae bacterium]
MSKKETQNADQAPEKVMTKYDLKMQRRKEEKERAEKSRRRDNILGVVIVAALVCLVASFPIRNYLTVHGSYVKVNGEDVSKVEFDYNYNVAVSNYLSQYAYYLYMMGIDPTSDFTSQMYSDTLTWGDYFQQMAVENMIRNKSLLAAAKAEGFAYDTAEDYAMYRESLEKAASENNTTAKSYLKELYGPYATESRLKPYVEEALYLAGYYDELSERQTPSMEDIQAYYEENKASYDSVDYYLMTVDAELPTEPTELADPVEETEGEEEAGAEDGAEGGEEQAYQPSEAEIEAAMAEAKEKADGAVDTVKADGELQENVKKSAATYLLQDWLFDEERKAGDSTVIEDSTGHRYYVVEFADRYLDEVLSSDIRVVVTDAENGQAILDEWSAGAATEESFAELCDKYNDPAVTVTEGGLLEAVTSSSVPADINAWIRDEARAVGDTAVISPEGEENTFVVYYSGTNEAEWILSIRQTLIGQRMNEYVEELTADGKVEDPKGNLRYLKVQAEAEAAAQESSEASDGAEGSSEDAGSEEGSAAAEGEGSSEDAGSEEGSEASDGAEGSSEDTGSEEGSEASDGAEGSSEDTGSEEGSEASDGAGESSEDAGASEETQNPEGSEASESAEDGGAEGAAE